MMLGVFEPTIIQGRHIGEAELAKVRSLLREHGDWSRWRLSVHLARLWDWRSLSGQLKDMAARTLLLKLEARGLIELPKRRMASPNPMGRKAGCGGGQALEAERVEGDLFPRADAEDVRGGLAELMPLGIEEISRECHPGKQAEFSRLLERHHYLGHRGTVGENMRYLASDRLGRVLACVLFGAAAWQCKARDGEIGWDAATRARGNRGQVFIRD